MKENIPVEGDESASAQARDMFNHDVVLIVSRPKASFHPGDLLGRHLDFMVGLEKKGVLLLSGPVTPESGGVGFGVTALNITDIETARAIWNEEPFFAAGQRDAEFFVWRLMEGQLELTIGLSDCSIQLGRARR